MSHGHGLEEQVKHIYVCVYIHIYIIEIWLTHNVSGA